MSFFLSLLGCLLFIWTWTFMAFNVPFFPIGRTLATLTGSILFLSLTILSPSDAYDSINIETLALLFGTMIMTILLEREGFFTRVVSILVWKCSNVNLLVGRIVFLSGLLSSLVTNDTTCVFLTPIVVEICERYDIPHGPILIALATSSNIGSSMTPTGNPQNMIIATVSHLSYGQFLSAIAVSAILGLGANWIFLYLYYNKTFLQGRINTCNAEMRRMTEEQEMDRREKEEKEEEEERKRGGSEYNSKERIIGFGWENIPKDIIEISLSLSSSAFLSSNKKENIDQHTNSQEDDHNDENESNNENEISEDEKHQKSSKDKQNSLASSFHLSPSPSSSTLSSHHKYLDSLMCGRSPHRYLYDLQHWVYVLNKPIETFRYENHKEEGKENRDLNDIPVSDQSSVSSHSSPPSCPSDFSAESSSLLSHPPPIRIATVKLPRMKNRRMVMQKPRVYSFYIAESSLSLSSLSLSHPLSVFSFLFHLLQIPLVRLILILLGTITAFICGINLGWASVGGAVFMMLLDRTDPEPTLKQVDWTLLVFFSSLFIVVRGFQETGVPLWVWNQVMSAIDTETAGGLSLYTIVIVGGSNTLSNVPLVLLLGTFIPSLPNANSAWLLLAFVSTIAGNLTLVGSVANLIVAARAKHSYSLEFSEYFVFGFPTTLIITAVGVMIMRGILG